MTCPSCRREIADGSRFCPFCGVVIDEKPAAAPIAPGAPGAPSAQRPAHGMPHARFQQRAGQAVALGAIGSLLAFGGCACGIFPVISIVMGWAAFSRAREELGDIDNFHAPRETRRLAGIGSLLGILSMVLGFVALTWSIVALLLQLA